jgi:GAF domain-containing protein
MTSPPDDTTTDLHAVIAALRREREAGLAREATLAEELAARDAALAQRNTQYSERIEHQTATVEVLKVMSASPGEAQPVFDLIVRQAKELCNCMGGALYEYDGELVHLRTNYGGDTDAATVAKYIAMFPMAPTRASFACRAIMDREVVHIRDTDAEPEQFAVMRALERKAQISVPLLRDGVAIGAIALGAEKAGGFSDSQVALLQTFADQAAIAITSAETYRALQTRTADLQESLEYQTATSDVLKVISRSTFDLQPVLDTVVETAARLCNAEMAAIVRPDGDLWRLGANCGFPSEFEAYQRARGAYPLDPTSPTVLARAMCERRTVHIHDVAAVPGYPDALIRLGKQRTSLGVPLLRDGATIGVLLLARQRVEPFTDRQIDLVSTFADQAVIAIENTRLLTEQREALEQQTATAEVLQVINASPGNLTPVFEAILNKAHALCGADLGSLTSYDGERFNRLATHGYPPEYEALVRARIESTPLRSDLQINNTSAEQTAPSYPETARWRALGARRRRDDAIGPG